MPTEQTIREIREWLTEQFGAAATMDDRPCTFTCGGRTLTIPVVAIGDVPYGDFIVLLQSQGRNWKRLELKYNDLDGINVARRIP